MNLSVTQWMTSKTTMTGGTPMGELSASVAGVELCPKLGKSSAYQT